MYFLWNLIKCRLEKLSHKCATSFCPNYSLSQFDLSCANSKVKVQFSRTAIYDRNMLMWFRIFSRKQLQCTKYHPRRIRKALTQMCYLILSKLHLLQNQPILCKFKRWVQFFRTAFLIWTNMLMWVRMLSRKLLQCIFCEISSTEY